MFALQPTYTEDSHPKPVPTLKEHYLYTFWCSKQMCPYGSYFSTDNIFLLSQLLQRVIKLNGGKGKKKGK
jgi:hypothetical protein